MAWGIIIRLHKGNVNLLAAKACSLSKTYTLGIFSPKVTLGSSIECLEMATSGFSLIISLESSCALKVLSSSFWPSVTPCLPIEINSKPNKSMSLWMSPNLRPVTITSSPWSWKYSIIFLKNRTWGALVKSIQIFT